MKQTDEWTTVTLFVSSTFADMDAERDHIRRIVIPQLEEFFNPLHVTIRVIDLRWGVNTKDDKNLIDRDAKILKVCMEEIDRSRPFFIGLLGSRYGWVPDDTRIKRSLPQLDMDRCHHLLQTNEISVTALEFYYGLFEKSYPSRSIVCIRNEEVNDNIPEDYQKKYIETQYQSQLNNLKKIITDYFHHNNKDELLVNYSPTWNGKNLDNLDEFDTKLYELLKRCILEDVGERQQSFENWIEKDIAEQVEFIHQNTRSFIGCESILTELRNNLENTENPIILFSGESGSGKSSIMCQLANELQKEWKDNPNHLLLFHSASVSGNASSVSNMLECFCLQISTILNEKYEPVEEGTEMSGDEIEAFSSWVSTFNIIGHEKVNYMSRDQIVLHNFEKLVKQATEAGIHLTLLIDAYDCFNKHSQLISLKWLSLLNVSTIISTIPDSSEELQKIPQSIIIQVPSFNETDTRNMITSLCTNNCKEVHSSVVSSLLTHGTCDYLSHYSPLWLKMATHALFTLDISDFEAIRDRQEEDNEAKIEQYMLDLVNEFPNLPGDMFIYLLKRAAENLGDKFVYQVMYYLAASRYGLRESDLSALLKEEWNEFTFSILRRWFRPYFTENGSDKQWNISHQLLKNKLNELNKKNLCETHKTLVRHFRNLKSDDPIRIRELMYHVTQSKESILFNYTYSCRLPIAIQAGTLILVDELESNPQLFEIFCEEIREMYQNNQESKDTWREINNNLQQKLNEGKDASESDSNVDKYKNNSSQSRHMYDRIVKTLSNHLMHIGKEGMNEKILQIVTPMMESDMDDLVVKEILLPNAYLNLRDIYEHSYNIELKEFYNQKNKELTQNTFTDFSRNFFIDLSKLNNTLENEDHEQIIHQTTELVEKELPEDWEVDWLDERAYLGLLLLHYTLKNPNMEDKDNFEDIYNAFTEDIANGNFEKKYSEEYLKTLTIWEARVNVLALFMENIAKIILPMHSQLAIICQQESCTLYKAVCVNSGSLEDIAEYILSLQATGLLYEKAQEDEKALSTYFEAQRLAKEIHMHNPDFEDGKMRILSIYRVLGDFAFKNKRYDTALDSYLEYKRYASELYENNPSRAQWQSSLVNALKATGESYLQLKDYESARQEFGEAINHVNELVKKANTVPFFSLMVEIYLYFSHACFCLEDYEKCYHSAQSARQVLTMLIDNGVQPNPENIKWADSILSAFNNQN